MERHDFLVERPVAFHTFNFSCETEPKKGHVLGGVVPAVDAYQRSRGEFMRRFLHDLAAARGDQRLARIEMARGLVQHPAPVDRFLDQQKLAAPLDDRGYRDNRLPDAQDFQAGLRVFFRMKSAMRATPASIACFDAAYEKRTCCPSP